ncbi:hypothetical protein J4430_03985 [Candidatus Woesearchaeota archaeon]|nr:hypothetical protein [Candidatus Woesearchaeota archaeon]
MQQRGQKVKACLEIIILILTIFAVYNPEQAYAKQTVCCERTIVGETCIQTGQEQCNPDYRSVQGLNCAQTDFCQVGCCRNNEGNCQANTPKATCKNQGGIFDPRADCNTQECRQGCCIIENQCSIETNLECIGQAATFGRANSEFRETLSEQECAGFCQQEEGGCCEKEGVCTIEKRGDCIQQEGDFFQNQHCSRVESCTCRPKDHKRCFEGDIYWFDSCNNKEDIIQECSYDQGLTCGEENGQFVCKSIDCLQTYNSPATEGDGGLRKNGESWCEYEGITGSGTDLVGSRHFRRLCVNGEEVIEPCRDYREQACVQTRVTGTGRGTYNEALCVTNNWEECATTCNTAKDARNNREFQQKSQEDRECCLDPQKSCSWIGNENQGRCIPQVPPGLKFWETKTTGQVHVEDAKEICSQASQECTVYYVKRTLLSSWKCEANCECERQPWIDQANAYCISLGDCGAYYNVDGDYTKEGLETNPPRAPQQEEFVKLQSAGRGLSTEDFDASQYRGLDAVPTKAWIQLGFATLGIIGPKIGLPSISALLGKAIGIGTAATTTGTATVTLSSLAAAETAAPVYTGIAEFATGNAISAANAAAGSTATGASAAGTILAAIPWIVLAVAVFFVIIHLFAKVKEKHYSVTCQPWQAPPGGANCDICGQDGKECTEYRCKSIGQACQYIPENEGTTRQSCFNAGRNDTKSPVIRPLQGKLTEGFQLRNTEVGYDITPEVEIHQTIEFGIETDELAKCKYANQPNQRFDDMISTIEGSSLKTTHSLTKSEGTGGQKDIYIRCQDVAGNKNERDYRISYQVSTVDLSPPRVELLRETDKLPNGVDQTILEVQVNEQAVCRYAKVDAPFEDMGDPLLCDQTPRSNGKYICSTNINLDQTTTYYIRCQDQQGNINTQGIQKRIEKTSELLIAGIQPQGELLENEIVIEIQTTGGAEGGKAICQMQIQGGHWVNMKNTQSTVHIQQLTLPEGKYNIPIRCEDEIGNQAQREVSFEIKQDRTPPKIKNIYKEQGQLVIILNEKGTCKIDTKSFSYEEGTIIGQEQEQFIIGLEAAEYHLICEDAKQNRMQEMVIHP